MSRDALTPHTCETARALLGWSQEQLAERSGVVRLTVQHFESGAMKPRYKTVTALLRAFRNAGVGFEYEAEAPCARRVELAD